MRKDSVDYVVHLGDYIYEYGNGEYGWGNSLDRIPLPDRQIYTSVLAYTVSTSETSPADLLKACTIIESAWQLTERIWIYLLVINNFRGFQSGMTMVSVAIFMSLNQANETQRFPTIRGGTELQS